jgi:hypothetical protein
LSASYGSSEKEKEKELDVFDQIAQDLRKYTRPASQDEFQDYCSGEPYDIGKITALEWWCQDQQRRRWPRLSYMALDILSIPAMSDEPERAFSRARRTISWERAQMDSETRIGRRRGGKRRLLVGLGTTWKREGAGGEELRVA